MVKVLFSVNPNEEEFELGYENTTKQVYQVGQKRQQKSKAQGLC